MKDNKRLSISFSAIIISVFVLAFFASFIHCLVAIADAYAFAIDYEFVSEDSEIRSPQTTSYIIETSSAIDVKDFETLVTLGVFNSSAMNEAVASFRRYEESSLGYSGINKHYGERVGLWDISIRHEELSSM